MNKLTILFLSIAILFSAIPAEEVSPEAGVTDLGSIRFPRPFIHAEINFAKGVYKVTLKQSDGDFIFSVSNAAGEFLFDEAAIVKEKKSRTGNRKFLLRNQILRGYEYFRIRVTFPDRVVMAYFLLGQVPEPEPAKESPAGEETPGIE